MRVLETAGRKFDLTFKWDEFSWSGEYRARHGRMMPAVVQPHNFLTTR
jgi:tartrate dehydrogenase/decarboxylase / D-malate dehydrogenase